MKELPNNPFGHGDQVARLARVYSKLTQGHFLQTFELYVVQKNVILKTMYVLTNPFWTVLAFFELWDRERTNWHPVSWSIFNYMHPPPPGDDAT